MADAKRARVGLLGMMIQSYEAWPEIKPALAQFGEELVRTLSPFAVVDFPGVCTTRDQVDQAVARFEADGLELLLVVSLSYAPSHIALPALQRTRLPILIWSTQELEAITRETRSADTAINHGLAGVQDLANVLRRTGCEFYFVAGHYRDERALAEVKSWCDAARIARFVRRMRIGLVGYPMEGMGDFALDETAFLGQAGIAVRRIAMKDLAARARRAPDEGIARQMTRDRATFRVQEGITPAQHEASSRLEWALREVLVERRLNGFASHFLAVGEDGWLDTLPFLAACKLLAEGYGFGGEGDVTSAAAVAMMAELAGAATFTEMFSVDWAGSSMLMMHMGEANWKMARQDEPIHLLRSTLGMAEVRVDPLLLAFSLQPGEATVVSLTTTAGGRLKLIAAEGQVLDFPYVHDLGRPHCKLQPQGDLCDFLTRFSLEGGSHHQAMAYGHWGSTVLRIASLLGIEAVQL